MATSQFALIEHPDWEILSSVSLGKKTFPEVNLYVVGPELGNMPFHIVMSLEQAQTMIDKLESSCLMIEEKMAKTISGTKQ